MKSTKRLLSSIVVMFCLIALSKSTVIAQNYVPKTEAIEILQTELKNVTASLPGINHNTQSYIIATEKIRVFKGILRNLEKGDSLIQALRMNVPSEDNRTFQPFVRGIQTSNGKNDPKWIIGVINGLLTV